jgi:MYXO-CTERM domain-containing protein
LNHPVMVELTDPYTNETKRGLDVNGSFSVSVDGQRLDAEYIDIEGKVLDHFTIKKGDGTTTPKPKPEASSDDEGGCGCRMVGDRSQGWFALATLGLLLVFRRRRAD